MTFTAVATLPDGTVMPFGPDFKSEDEGWRYLHGPDLFAPAHRSLDILETGAARLAYLLSLEVPVTQDIEFWPDDLLSDEIPF